MKYMPNSSLSFSTQATNKDNLLILDLSKGWEPLCEFLNKPVPDVPFPHLNKNSSLLETVLTQHPVANQLHAERMISLAICVTLPICIACNLYFKPWWYSWTFSGINAVLNKLGYFRDV